MVTNEQLASIAKFFKNQNTTAGCLIGFQGNNSSRVLYKGDKEKPNFYERIIVIEEIVHGQAFQIKEQNLPETPTTEIPNYLSNSSQIIPEAIGASLSCGAMILGGMGIMAAGALTGGLATIVLGAAWIGTMSGSLQCVIGLGRVAETILNPDDNSLQRIDADAAYQAFDWWLDAVGLASMFAAPAAGIWRLLRSRGGLTMTKEALEKIPRGVRAKVIKEAFERLVQSGMSRSELFKAIEPLKIPKAVFRAKKPMERMTVAIADSGLKLLDSASFRFQFKQYLKQQVFTKENILTIGVNLLPSNVVGSASGALNSSIMSRVAPEINTCTGFSSVLPSQPPSDLKSVANTIVIHIIEVKTNETISYRP
jgi:hypothetical protein